MIKFTNIQQCNINLHQRFKIHQKLNQGARSSRKNVDVIIFHSIDNKQMCYYVLLHRKMLMQSYGQGHYSPVSYYATSIINNINDK